MQICLIFGRSRDRLNGILHEICRREAPIPWVSFCSLWKEQDGGPDWQCLGLHSLKGRVRLATLRTADPSGTVKGVYSLHALLLCAHHFELLRICHGSFSFPVWLSEPWRLLAQEGPAFGFAVERAIFCAKRKETIWGESKL